MGEVIGLTAAGEFTHQYPLRLRHSKLNLIACVAQPAGVNGLAREKWRDFLIALDATGGPDGQN